MPSISDTLLTPLVTAFQASYPNVRVKILVTEGSNLLPTAAAGATLLRFILAAWWIAHWCERV
jgi:hypothetical protein